MTDPVSGMRGAPPSESSGQEPPATETKNTWMGVSIALVAILMAAYAVGTVLGAANDENADGEALALDILIAAIGAPILWAIVFYIGEGVKALTRSGQVDEGPAPKGPPVEPQRTTLDEAKHRVHKGEQSVASGLTDDEIREAAHRAGLTPKEAEGLTELQEMWRHGAELMDAIERNPEDPALLVQIQDDLGLSLDQARSFARSMRGDDK